MIEIGEPFQCRSGIHRAVAGGVRCAPLGNKERKSFAECGIRLAAQPFLMRACIEMQGVHNIVKVQRVGCGCVDVLTPGRGADKDYRLRRILPDNGNDRLGIRLDIAAPAHSALRLVADFIQKVRNPCVFRSDIGEEFCGLLLIGLRIAVRKDMPVDDYILIKLDCGVDQAADLCFVPLRIPDVAAVALEGIHCNPENAGLPFVSERLHGFRGGQLREPGDPGGADAAQDNRLAGGAAELRADHLKLPVCRYGSSTGISAVFGSRCRRRSGFRNGGRLRCRGRFRGSGRLWNFCRLSRQGRTAGRILLFIPACRRRQTGRVLRTVSAAVLSGIGRVLRIVSTAGLSRLGRGWCVASTAGRLGRVLCVVSAVVLSRFRRGRCIVSAGRNAGRCRIGGRNRLAGRLRA